MTQFACWVLFGAVLLVLSLGCGLLLERAAGFQLPEPLVLPAGLAVITVAAELPTKLGATAKLATPAIVVLALLGFVVAKPWRRPPRLGRWPLLSALAVYLFFLAPVLFTGRPTFTGYIKLDDTATWMGMTDWVLSHGHDLSGLAPSSFETTLHYYLNGGEPVGALLPWGIGARLVGQDLAWVFQPYLALMGAMLALSLWAIVSPLIPRRSLRALVVFIAAQSALLYGYSLWGGVKEVGAAWVFPLVVATGMIVIESRSRWRSFLPLAAAAFAMLSVLAYGGAVWLAGVLVVVALVTLRTWLRRAGRARAIGLVALALLLAAGLIRGGITFANANGALTGEELGNLLHPLSWLQLFGIWPAGDFRVNPPNLPGLTYALVALVIVGGLLALVNTWRARRWALWLYVSAGVVGLLLVDAKGSPWVVGKALAIASPALLVAGLSGWAWLMQRARPLPGEEGPARDTLVAARRGGAAFVIAAVASGVLLSNVLAYRHVTLAPYAQFRELQHIGDAYAGDGPTLINEYQPYAARHFLRNMDPESPSELRRRDIPLLSGQLLQKGGYADLDQFQLPALLVYRTIVTRTSPAASRPPQPYRLVYSGTWYQVWQRPVRLSRRVLSALPLGTSVDPAGVPDCSAVLGLARSSSSLAAVARSAPWVESVPSPLPDGDTRRSFSVPAAGRYQLWLGGSFFQHLDAYVDGIHTGSSFQQLNETGQWTPLGTIRLAAGAHQVTLSYGDASLYPGGAGPGSAGPFFPVGPLAVARVTASLPITYVQPSSARSLCGKRWDWIQALGSPRPR